MYRRFPTSTSCTVAFGWVLSSGLSYGWLVIKHPRSCTAKAISAGFETQHRSCMGTKPWKKTIESELRASSWCQRAMGHGNSPSSRDCARDAASTGLGTLPKGKSPKDNMEDTPSAFFFLPNSGGYRPTSSSSACVQADEIQNYSLGYRLNTHGVAASQCMEQYQLCLQPVSWVENKQHLHQVETDGNWKLKKKRLWKPRNMFEKHWCVWSYTAVRTGHIGMVCTALACDSLAFMFFFHRPIKDIGFLLANKTCCVV